MVSRVHLIGWRLAAALLLLASLSACGDPPHTPEAEIRELVRRTAEAAEAGEAGAMAEAVHADYRDARGNDRTTLVRMLRLYVLRQGSLFVIPDIETIEIHGADSASLTLTARFAEADPGRLRLEAGVYRFELDLVREDDWQVLSARWGRADGRLR